ncbi:MAG: hypothetical protein HY657_01720 [Acidobacteria bacterium]|nr:hypothetical protein [Acidobacteriota bacterium]
MSASLFDETRRANLRAGMSTLAWLTLVQASYYACLIVFMADLGAGARRLDRSTLLRDPTFRTIATAARAVVLMTVLLYVVAAAACAWPGRRAKPLE